MVLRPRSFGTVSGRDSGHKPAPPAVAVLRWAGSAMQRSRLLGTAPEGDSGNKPAPPAVAVPELVSGRDSGHESAPAAAAVLYQYLPGTMSERIADANDEFVI